MNIIFDIASNIATPLALGGFFAGKVYNPVSFDLSIQILPKHLIKT
jgi:hypothetical protein